jgi:uncharacterized protein YjbI with pentapeptide repeats
LFIADSSNTVIVSVMVEEKGRQAEERQDEPRLWRPWRPPKRRMGWRVLWAVGMVVAVLTTGLLIVNLHPEIWKHLLEERTLTLIAMGGSLTAIIVLLAIGGASLGWTGFGDKTFWDWLQLLSALAIPVVLAAAGLWFTSQQDQRQQQIENERAQQAQKIEDQRAAAERALAEQRADDEALQAYLSQMSSLLLERGLRGADKDSEVSTLARARTVTVLQRLDTNRNQTVIRFLSEARLTGSAIGLLVEADLAGAHLRGSDLNNADLSDANLNNAGLSDANLTDAYLSDANLGDAHLSNADLSGADLSGAILADAHLLFADLSGTDLSRANVSDAELIFADLSGAHLRGAYLRGAYLGAANLSGADLSGAYLNNVDLSQANLSGADLSDAHGITNEELEQQLEQPAKSLEGTTMPSGQKYEDWLKDKEG